MPECAGNGRHDLRKASCFNVAVSYLPYLFHFPVHALKRGGTRGVGSTVHPTLTETTDVDLALRSSWLGTGGRTAVSRH